MGLKIDLYKEGGLTEEERTYLEVRDRWHDIAAADGLSGGDEARQRYEARVAEKQSSSGTTGNVDTGDGDDTPYEDLTVAKLKAELEDRHRAAVEAGEVDEVEASTRFALTGNKQELIDRLYEDDRLVALADAGE